MVGVKSDVGIVRSLNEDYAGFVENRDYKLYVVADGMGGHNAGEVASELAVKSVKEFIKENYSEDYDDVLRKAIEYANKAIYEKATLGNELRGMGTTIVVALVTKSKVVVGNIGDSMALGISDGNIVKITKDHSLVQELIDSGSITEVEGRNHPKKNVITRALGTNLTVEVDIYEFDLSKYNKYILCSDGLSNEVLKEEIFTVVENSEDYNEVCDELVELAKSRGGRDNITVLLFGGEV